MIPDVSHISPQATYSFLELYASSHWLSQETMISLALDGTLHADGGTCIDPLINRDLYDHPLHLGMKQSFMGFGGQMTSSEMVRRQREEKLVLSGWMWWQC